MVLGCPSLSHQWDQHRHSLFPLWVRGTGIRLQVLHKHLRFHKQAKEAKLWVEVEDRSTGLDFGDSGPCLRHYPTD